MDLGSLGLPSGPEPTVQGRVPLPCPDWLTPVRRLTNAWKMPPGSAMIPVGESKALRGSPSQRAGKRYEKRVMAFLQTVFPARLSIGPWYGFTDDHGTRYCQPDAILESWERIVIFEVKRTHSNDAWWQLRHLYEPVVAMAVAAKGRSREIVVCEICKSYDPVVALSEEPVLLRDLLDVEERSPQGFFVVQWR